MVSGQLRTGANDLAAIEQRHFRDIIGDQAIPPLDQLQHGFALADAALATNKHPDPVDVHHAALDGRARRKKQIQFYRGQVHESHSHHRRVKNRNTNLVGDCLEFPVYPQVSSENDAGNLIRAKLPIALDAFLHRKRLEVIGLSVADHLDALEGDIFREAGQR